MSKREMTTRARKYVLGKIYIVNTLLILCHLGFALIYDYYDMNILFFTNFGNIALCLLACFFLNQKKLKEYVHVMFYELYMFMIVSIFFCDFYLNKNQTISKRSVAMGVFNMLLYVGLRLWTYYSPFVYTFANSKIEHGIFFANSVLTFFFVITYMLIYSTTVNKLENNLRNMAERDALTGLFNRRKMRQILNDTLASNKSSQMMVAMFDVDYFKNINDTYGHDAEVAKNSSPYIFITARRNQLLNPLNPYDKP